MLAHDPTGHQCNAAAFRFCRGGGRGIPPNLSDGEGRGEACDWGHRVVRSVGVDVEDLLVSQSDSDKMALDVLDVVDQLVRS